MVFIRYVDKDSADGSLERSGDTVVEAARLARRRADKRYCYITEQRNIGSPVIVKVHSESLSLFHIPKVLRSPNEGVQTKKDTSENVSVHENGRTCERIVTELLKTDQKLGTGRKPSQNICNDVRARPGKSGKPCRVRGNVTNVHSAGEIISNVKNDNQYPIRFYCLRNKVVVVMSKGASFHFVGKLVARVLHGAIRVYGYVITTENDSMEIYSPKGYGNVSIETSEKFSENTKLDIWRTLSLEGIDRDRENKLVTDIEQLEPGMAVVLFSNLENQLTQFLNAFYPFRLFPRIRNSSYESWTNLKRAEEILQSNIYIGRADQKQLRIEPRVLEEISVKMLNRWRANEWSCTLIAGGNGVGKSVTSRYMVNSLLPVSKMVVLVDVDIGQAECTPPGCISYCVIDQPLMGPNFTHLKTPEYQLYMGDVSVVPCITRYIEGMKMLMDKLSNCPILSRLPIVVNTMGFSQGIGWDIITFTIKLIRPSFLLQIMSEKSKNNYIGYLSKQVVNRQVVPWSTWKTNVIVWSEPCDHQLFVANSQVKHKGGTSEQENWNLEPYKKRELVMVSYLSEIEQKPGNTMTQYDATSVAFNEAVPYVIPFASLFISISRASVPLSHVLNVVNGNIVALCGIDAETNESEVCEITFGLRVLSRPPLCSCYGFGIVRGVDLEREEIFLNTPLPVSMMQHVNCLVGCIPLPTTLLQSDKQKNVPYTGENDALPMSREHRRGYFRMRYQREQNNARR
ncbi:PREDICTED: polynucleotide 5'-hydroxyl-kinase NOL9 isoform X2 [Habropoda laboriosa]|uniref:polynucleotide 5'-hydroxyl-kinase NOL9 isoform X2 n=1 Tax=Habropoda laboriosa TaxID=597456 RepID=UPI00083E2DB0|nr:PREDICTED: polynucleotide 5'-hydroxyl-kinase NOL9 isoform X2 [Habropoda laboriosa]